MQIFSGGAALSGQLYGRRWRLRDGIDQDDIPSGLQRRAPRWRGRSATRWPCDYLAAGRADQRGYATGCPFAPFWHPGPERVPGEVGVRRAPLIALGAGRLRRTGAGLGAAGGAAGSGRPWGHGLADAQPTDDAAGRPPAGRVEPTRSSSPENKGGVPPRRQRPTRASRSTRWVRPCRTAGFGRHAGRSNRGDRSSATTSEAMSHKGTHDWFLNVGVVSDTIIERALPDSRGRADDPAAGSLDVFGKDRAWSGPDVHPVGFAHEGPCTSRRNTNSASRSPGSTTSTPERCCGCSPPGVAPHRRLHRGAGTVPRLPFRNVSERYDTRQRVRRSALRRLPRLSVQDQQLGVRFFGNGQQPLPAIWRVLADREGHELGLNDLTQRVRDDYVFTPACSARICGAGLTAGDVPTTAMAKATRSTSTRTVSRSARR